MNALSTALSVLAKVWKALPNRLVAAAVFLGGVGAIFWAYASFFVLDVSTVKFSVAGVASAQVRLTGSYQAAGMYGAISGGTGADCPGACSFPKMPPVRYEWSASAPGYETATGAFDLPPRAEFSVSAELAPSVRYGPFSAENARAVAEARVRRDLAAALSGAPRSAAGRAAARDAASAALSGAQVWLPVSGGRAVLRSDAFDGGWAWWGAGRAAPLFPGRAGMVPAAADAPGALALFRDSDGRQVLVDAQVGMTVPVEAPGPFDGVARGPSANLFLLGSRGADAVLYDASALAVAATMTGAADAAWFPDGSRVELARDGSASWVSAAGERKRWPLPSGASALSADGADLVVSVPGGFSVAADAPSQAKLLAR